MPWKIQFIDSSTVKCPRVVYVNVASREEALAIAHIVEDVAHAKGNRAMLGIPVSSSTFRHTDLDDHGDRDRTISLEDALLWALGKRTFP